MNFNPDLKKKTVSGGLVFRIHSIFFYSHCMDSPKTLHDYVLEGDNVRTSHLSPLV